MSARAQGHLCCRQAGRHHLTPAPHPRAAFLPTLEKFGKSCQLLLGTDDVNFIQTPVNTDGACVSARFRVVRVDAGGGGFSSSCSGSGSGSGRSKSSSSSSSSSSSTRLLRQVGVHNCA